MLGSDGDFSALPCDLIALAQQLEQLGGDAGDSRVAELETIVRIKNVGPIRGPSLASLDEKIAQIDRAFAEQLSAIQRASSPPAQHVWTENGRDVVVRSDKRKGKRFRCGAAFSHNSTNEDIAEVLVHKIIDEWVWKGFNVSVLGYGASGSGKTYTLSGGNSCLLDLEGDFMPSVKNSLASSSLLWQCLSHLYDLVFREDNKEIKVGVSCWDVTPDNRAVDLLVHYGPVLDDRASHGKKFCTVGCSTLKAVAQVLNAARRVSENWRKPHGNRVHSFTRITILNKARATTLHFIDLVGTSPKFAAGTGDRLDELDQQNINKQLIGVGKLFSEISEMGVNKQKSGPILPARDSKLTQILAPLIASNHKCFFLATITNGKEDFKSNMATLRLATRAGLISTACMRQEEENINKTFLPFELMNFSKELKPEEIEKRSPRRHSKYLPKEQEQEDVADSVKQLEPVNESNKKPKKQTRMRRIMMQNESEMDARSAERQSLLDKINVVEAELTAICAENAEKAAKLQEENRHLAEWCENSKSNASKGAILEMYQNHRADALKTWDECAKIIVQTEAKFEGGVFDIVGLTRARIKAVREEVENLEQSLIPLRKRAKQFQIRDRWVDQLSRNLDNKLSDGTKTEELLLQSKQDVDTLMASVHMIETERERRLHTTDQLMRDREATSKEVVAMRKYISKVETDAERQDLLNCLNCGRNKDIYDVSDMLIPASLETLLKRLDNLVNRMAPHLSTHIANIYTNAEQLGVQRSHVAYRENQTRQALQDLLSA